MANAIDWYWCLKNPYSNMSRDLYFIVLDNRLIVTKELFDIAWILYGGVVDDFEYEYYVRTFELTLEEVEIPGQGLVEVYSLGLTWWIDVRDTVLFAPVEDRVCKMPRWDQ